MHVLHFEPFRLDLRVRQTDGQTDRHSVSICHTSANKSSCDAQLALMQIEMGEKVWGNFPEGNWRRLGTWGSVGLEVFV